MDKRTLKAKKEKIKSEKKEDLEILQEIRDTLFVIFNDNPFEVKAGDILKVIELKWKLGTAAGDNGQKAFWELLNRMRQEEIAKKEITTTGRKSSKKEVETQ